MTPEELLAWRRRGFELMRTEPYGSPWYVRGLELSKGDI